MDPEKTVNDISFKEYVTTLLADRDKAGITAAASMDKRLEGIIHDLRTLTDQSGHFISRTDHELLANQINQVNLQLQTMSAQSITRDELKLVHDGIEKLRDANVAITSRSQTLNQIFLGSMTALAVLIAFLSWRHDVQPLPNNQDSQIAVISSKLDAITQQFVNHLQIAPTK